MEGWRELLAKDIALHNRDLSQRQLNLLVQRTIDRIVFLRIAEDRDIEAYERLRRAAKADSQVYEELKRLFIEADDKYNSGLFHFSDEKRASDPDRESLKIHIPDEPLRLVIEKLYYPESPYEFSVMPAEILGQVYEQFLGKVIELSPGGAVRIEEKPEVRKAGGVYYTPSYIVDYIVENTVGELLKGITPAEAAKIRILDPACGSGSFLVGAYQYLLDWHLRYYAEHPQQYRNRRRETKDGMILSTAEKRRILQNNIYGVDLDQNAVEVSKLSLLLKMLENESDAAGRQTLMFAAGGRILPDLSDNIKWGNSLIGSDFFRGPQATLFADEEEMLKVKAFDWDSEAGFGEIMAAGGFDAVIGNPPYIRIQTMKETAPETVPYYKKNYVSASKGNYDIYVVFVERGLQLLNECGLLGFILPHKFFNAKYGEPLRGLVSSGNHLRKIIHFGAEQVFEGATTYTCLLFLQQSGQSELEFVKAHDLEKWIATKDGVTGTVSSHRASSNEWNFIVGSGSNLFYRLSDSNLKLGDLTDIFVGLQTSADKVYMMDLVEETDENYFLRSKSLQAICRFEKGLLRPIVSGTDVNRFTLSKARQYILFPYSVEDEKATLIPFNHLEERFPLTADYLLRNRETLERRERGKFRDENWYRFGRNQNLGIQERVKLCIPRLVERLYMSFDEHGEYYLDNVDVCGVNIKPKFASYDNRFFLGLLNSTLLRWYFPFVSAPFRGNWLSANRQFLSQLPICTIDFDNSDDVQIHNAIVKLVDEMLDLHKQLTGLTGEGRRINEALIATVDSEIDALVYRLYGLSDDEVAIVEGGR
ncbi:MAG: Eco57I restriction-modification methylase domain-containing protein [Chloroflexota bacterium]|nr:Eco57I restriction-modification methylase domain-containing protein [Chloroflexota bacterium]MDE2908402.1 Eco57I restriction-modification methylase domain-containing protein [Chloroflexota bacterium]